MYQTIKKSRFLKQLALWMLMPTGQARPRLWVRWLVTPFFARKGRGASIRPRTRMDIFPFKEFSLGRYSTVEDFCTLNNAVGDIHIGDRTRIGIGSVLIGPVQIGDKVRLAQHVAVSAINHNYTDVSVAISEQGITHKKVVIEDEAWIGANAVVLPGVVVGKHSVVAAGSVVTKDVPPYTVVAGNPARPVKRYDRSAQTWERV